MGRRTTSRVRSVVLAVVAGRGAALGQRPARHGTPLPPAGRSSPIAAALVARVSRARCPGGTPGARSSAGSTGTGRRRCATGRRTTCAPGIWHRLRYAVGAHRPRPRRRGCGLLVLRHRRSGRPARLVALRPAGRRVVADAPPAHAACRHPSAFGSEVYALSRGARRLSTASSSTGGRLLPRDPLRPSCAPSLHPARAWLGVSRAGTVVAVTGRAGAPSGPDRWDGVRWTTSARAASRPPGRRRPRHLASGRPDVAVGGRLVGPAR